jgi:predicted acyl esterase
MARFPSAVQGFLCRRHGPVLAVLALLALVAPSARAQDRSYEYSIRREFLTMRDGVRLAVTWWIPKPQAPLERFPALLELLPYRKDDSFYDRDFPLYDYFVRRGFLLAKVDIRGTGGSDGAVPTREYSEEELDDAVDIIAQLGQHPASSGRVGMWGISWGGFNAIQVAMRRPPALRAILALHASDDLYHDDVRYIDGGLHIDPYALQIDHENGLPRTPAYALDAAYFRQRFEAYPWILTYLRQPVDGDFWRRNALRYRPEALAIPAYLIGGLLDGYRDTPIRALDYLGSPTKVEIGPWTHAWPDNGTPGPNYEWRRRAVRWWNHWLRDEDTGLLDEPRLLVYQRSGHGPARTLVETPGYWRFEDWPVAGGRREEWRFAPAGRLEKTATGRGPEAKVGLKYLPGHGVMAGDWWGEPTGDMRRDDAGSLVFDGPLLEQPVVVLGIPRVRLRFTAGAPLANWTARLEDVAPDGEVALVTGGVVNGTHHGSTLAPARLVPGENYDLVWDLHFTTWIFRRGHRIRLAVSNAQFPMIWPSPYPMTSQVWLGGPASALELPVVPETSPHPPATLPHPAPRAERPDVTYLDDPAPVERIGSEPLTGRTTVEWSNRSAWSIGKTRFDYSEREVYGTHDGDPANSTFLGVASHRIRPPGRDLRLETTIEIRSDSAAFHVTVIRRLWSNGQPVRRKRWEEAIPRAYH